MKTYSEKKRRSNDSKYGYHKSLIPCTKRILNWFYVFCENTSLHGFRYITINGSTMIGHIFWFAACLSAIVFCVILMHRLWDNYSKNPIATTIDTSNPIWELSFPAVTVCNNNKVYRRHADIIAKNLYMNGFSTDESDKFFSSLMKLIRPDKISTDNVTASHVLDNLNITVETLMLKLMQPCSSLLVRCAWIGKIYDCNKIFKTVMSREGLCCAFNSHFDMNDDYNRMYHLDDADADTAEPLNVTSDDLLNVTNILKVPGSGRDLGLTVALNIEGDMYKATSRPYIGATVLINDPIDFPDIGVQVAPVLPGHVLAISVAGSFIRSMESMRGIPPEKRKCYFDNEKPGVRYSYQSCVSECIAKYIQRSCNCLPFYYPAKHDGVRTCYLPDINCLLAVRKSIPDYSDTCKKCLPQCNEMRYHINVENVKMDDVAYDSDITRGLDVHKVSFVYVFFGDVSYDEYRKENTINWDVLLASFGGIFGLCLGGSVLSAIEIVYLLMGQILKKRLPRGRAKQLPASLPPASEMFLSIPVEKVLSQRAATRDQPEADDKRIFVTWQQPTTLHRRKTIKLGDRKRGKP